MPAQPSPVQIKASDLQFGGTLRDRFALLKQLLAILSVLHAQLGVALRLERGEESGRHGGFDEGTERCGRAHGEEAEFRRHFCKRIVVFVGIGEIRFLLEERWTICSLIIYTGSYRLLSLRLRQGGETAGVEWSLMPPNSLSALANVY
jgi:hypothetical protein